MKIIERLRELVVRVKQVPKAFTAKEMAEWSAADAEVYAALPALLAEVERLTKERDALLAEVRAWRAFERNPIPTNERSTMKAVYASKIATDAAVKGVE